MTESEAYSARDEETKAAEEKPAIIVTPFTDESLAQIHLVQIDLELADTFNTLTEERKNELLKERLDVLSRLVRERRSR